MNRSSPVRALSPTDDMLLEPISLHSVDQLSVYGQESGLSAPFNHAACTGSPDAGQAQSRNTFRRPWSARLRSYRQSRKNAWRTVLKFNVLMTLAIFLFNASFFIIAAEHHDSIDGSLYSGSCPKTKTFAMISHIVINIFGTLLLSASNYTMQILASPSRNDLDSAHTRSISLSIGVQSFRNLRFMGYTRLALWVTLAIASIPLHLLYNSTAFTTTRQSAYVAAGVKSNFDQGGDFDFDIRFTNKFAAKAPVSTPEVLDGLPLHYSSQTPDSLSSSLEERHYGLPNIPAVNGDLILELREKAHNLELINRTINECFKMYLESRPVNYRHIIAISSHIASNNSLLWLDSSSSPNESSENSVCAQDCQHNLSCYAWNATEFDLSTLEQYAKCEHVLWQWNGYQVSRCLVDPTTDPCLLRYNSSILIIVLIAIVAKLAAMSVTLVQYRKPALATVGDALASFLETPDCTTNQMCLTGKDEFDFNIWNTGPKQFSRVNAEIQRSAGASQLQWEIATVLLVFSFIGGAVGIVLVYDTNSGKDARLDWGSSSPTSPDAAEIGRGLPESMLICVANLPQLVLSFYYILCNRLMTCMAGAREWSMFAHQKKGLRTSHPRGSQRSTYWLQLPLRFSLPMMGVSSLLHYVASQSVQFGSTKYYDYPGRDGKQVLLEDTSGLGYSRTAIHVLIVLFISAFAAIVTWGQGHNRLGMPPCGFNSAAISAACHPPAEEQEPHLKPVQWGAVPTNGGRDVIGHCSFSSGEVTMPIEGRMYM